MDNGMPPPTRVPPRLPVHAMKTYSAVSPTKSHFRVGTCEEAGCIQYRDGWQIRVQTLREMPNGEALVAAVKSCGKKFTVVDVSADETWLVFEAGQNCFEGDAGRHRVRIDRPEVFIVRDGDWRGNPTGIPPKVMRGEDWQDDMNNSRDKIMTRLQQG